MVLIRCFTLVGWCVYAMPGIKTKQTAVHNNGPGARADCLLAAALSRFCRVLARRGCRQHRSPPALFPSPTTYRHNPIEHRLGRAQRAPLAPAVALAPARRLQIAVRADAADPAERVHPIGASPASKRSQTARSSTCRPAAAPSPADRSVDLPFFESPESPRQKMKPWPGYRMILWPS